MGALFRFIAPDACIKPKSSPPVLTNRPDPPGAGAARLGASARWAAPWLRRRAAPWHRRSATSDVGRRDSLDEVTRCLVWHVQRPEVQRPNGPGLGGLGELGSGACPTPAPFA